MFFLRIALFRSDHCEVREWVRVCVCGHRRCPIGRLIRRALYFLPCLLIYDPRRCCVVFRWFLYFGFVCWCSLRHHRYLQQESCVVENIWKRKKNSKTNEQNWNCLLFVLMRLIYECEKMLIIVYLLSKLHKIRRLAGSSVLRPCAHVLFIHTAIVLYLNKTQL